MYADDLVIIMRHQKPSRTIKEIQKVSEEYNLKFNASKSNWIRAKKHKGKNYSLEETYNVAEADNYKYLGIVLD